MSSDVGPARGVLRATPAAGAFHHARIAPSPALEAMVQHYWSVRWDLGDGIAADAEITRVDAVLARWPMHLRTLQRLFREYVGASPKWVINRYRLHEALARMDAGAHIDWAGFALALGYFDQAHFIRDFKALVGRTPTEYLRR